MVKYFKVTSERFNSPAYYAGYALEKIMREVYSDYNSQFLCHFEQVELADIPSSAIIHAAGLSREDARIIFKETMVIANV